jgi:predicted amidohydrolase YtcJ
MARYDQIRKLKALGASANVNLYYVWLRGEMYPNVLGRDRAHHLSPVATFLKAGVPTTFHSDSPVAPPRPLLGMSVGIARYGRSDSTTMGEHECPELHQTYRRRFLDRPPLDGTSGQRFKGKIPELEG